MLLDHPYVRHVAVSAGLASMVALFPSPVSSQEGSTGDLVDGGAGVSRQAVAEKALHLMGSDIAQALGEKGTREWLRHEIEASPFVEKRLAFHRHLEQSEVRRMFLRSEKLQRSWPLVLEILPDLELYFPMQEHREARSPDAKIEVAVPVAGSESYRLYRVDGSVVEIDGSFEPKALLLILGPSSPW